MSSLDHWRPCRWARVPPVLSLVAICVFLTSLPVSAQVEDACHDQTKHVPFISRSLQLVMSGVPREQVLEELLCIAINSKDRSEVETGTAAMRALFHIAETDELTQQYLLRIITADNVSSGARRTASTLIVYVADEVGRRALLEEMKAHWPRMRSTYPFNALIELGDPELLRWLEDGLSAMSQDDRRRRAHEFRAKFIRLQRVPADLIAYIRSDEGGPDRGWAVRQAMRHGAEPEQVAEAVFHYCTRARDKDRDRWRIPSVLAAAGEYGILKDTDVETIRVLNDMEQKRPHTDPEAVSPGWATRVEEKRAEFYRLNWREQKGQRAGAEPKEARVSETDRSEWTLREPEEALAKAREVLGVGDVTRLQVDGRGLEK